jgi:hypothetical protein
MYRMLSHGYEVVYAKRRSRKGETLLKRLISYFGYAAINRLSDIDIPRNTGDFRIMTRRVIAEFAGFESTKGGIKFTDERHLPNKAFDALVAQRRDEIDAALSRPRGR